MSEAIVYLDSSAIIKLIFDEPETPALADFLVEWPNRVCSTLGRLDVLRTSRRVGDPVVTRHAHDILTGVHLVRADEGILAAAAALEQPTLRTLDSIHLATALSLGPDLAGMVVYDRQLREAARAAGLKVWAPT